MKISSQEIRILNFLRYGAIILVIILSFIITNIFIEQKKEYLKNELETLETSFISKNKTNVQNLVNNIHRLILIEKDTAKIQLKEKIKEEVYKAHAIATTIYNENRKKANYSKKDTINQIKEVLRSIKFSNGNAYIFIDSISGEKILHEIKDFEGQNFLEFKDATGYQFVKTIVKTIKDKTETFDEYYWYKGKDRTNSYKKIGFYKYFEPYDFAIGSGDYVDDFEKNLQTNVLKKINALKLKKPEHIFIYDSKGLCLSNPKKKLIGVNRYNAKNKYGKYVLREILEYTLKNKEGFVQYKGAVILNQGNKTNDKISFLKLVDDWKWMIGSGFYLEEMYTNLDEKKNMLELSANKTIDQILYFSILITLIMMVVSFYLTRILHKIFLTYKFNFIKEENKNKKELSKNAQLYEDLFEANKSIILLIEPNSGLIINANQAALNFYGYTKKKFLTMNINDINTLDEEKIKEELLSAKNSKRHYFNFIHKLSNGEEKNVRITTSVTKYLETTVLYSVIVDSSEEYLIKEQLSQTEHKFKTIFDFANIGFAIRNTKGEFIQVNKKLLNMFGYEESFLLNKNCIHLSKDANIENEILLFQKLINQEITNYNIEKNYIRKNSSTFQAILTMASVVNDNNELECVSSSIIDISELKEKERLLREQSKMASMGEMMASIAHQWKQPINLISTSILPLKMNIELEEEVTKEELERTLESIELGVNHLVHTIDDFRNFFNPNKERVLFKVSTAFEQTFRLLSSQFKTYNIEVIASMSEVELYGSQNELQQVLINILKNAKEALDEKILEGKKYIFIDTYSQDDNVILKIKDNAGGVKKDIINDIFKPYVTTKEKKSGTGIGLYMSKQIIEDSMKGTIHVKNSEYIYKEIEYKGAEFIFSIPLNRV